jgi:cytochrome c-type biogenesis protein CcmH/NrfF
MHKSAVLGLLFLGLYFPGGVVPLKAQSDNLVPPPMPPAQAEIYAHVTSRVLAPCCWSQPVQIHQSEAAGKVRAEVIAFIRQGHDEREIFDRLAAEYGERILGEPRGAKGTVAYVTPFVILGLSLACLGIALLRISRRRPRLSFRDGGPLPDLPDDL